MYYTHNAAAATFKLDVYVICQKPILESGNILSIKGCPQNVISNIVYRLLRNIKCKFVDDKKMRAL